jgi:hypothetical protein
MSTRAKHAATTPIPVQLSAPEFNEFILPHLSRPKRGPKCKIGYHRLFNLILWVLYTGMQWKCLPIPKDPTGKPEIHYTNVYRAFAKWSDDGSLQQAFIASVSHLSDEKQLDLSGCVVIPSDAKAWESLPMPTEHSEPIKSSQAVDVCGESVRRGTRC